MNRLGIIGFDVQQLRRLLYIPDDFKIIAIGIDSDGVWIKVSSQQLKECDGETIPTINIKRRISQSGEITCLDIEYIE